MVIQEYFVKRVKFTSMKKVIMFFILSVMMIGVVSSCGTDGDLEDRLNFPTDDNNVEVKKDLLDDLTGVWGELMDDKYFFTIDSNKVMKYYFDREILGIGKVKSVGDSMLVVDNEVMESKDTIHITHKQGGEKLSLVTLKFRIKKKWYKDKYIEQDDFSFLRKTDEEIVPSYEGKVFRYDYLSIVYGSCAQKYVFYTDRMMSMREYVKDSNRTLQEDTYTYIPRKIGDKEVIYYTKQDYFIWVYRYTNN